VQQHILGAVGNKDLVGNLLLFLLCVQLMHDLLAIAKFPVSWKLRILKQNQVLAVLVVGCNFKCICCSHAPPFWRFYWHTHRHTNKQTNRLCCYYYDKCVLVCSHVHLNMQVLWALLGLKFVMFCYAGIHSAIPRTSLPNGDPYADRKNGRKQKGLLKTFGEVFR